jgi:hypothetical protein
VILICLNIAPSFIGQFINYYLELVPFPLELNPQQQQQQQYSSSSSSMTVQADNDKETIQEDSVMNSFRFVLVGVLLLNLVAVASVERFSRML